MTEEDEEFQRIEREAAIKVKQDVPETNFGNMEKPVQEPVAFLDWYDHAIWGNEDFKAGCWRAWDAAIKYTTPPAYDQGWKDGYKRGAWANTPAPQREWVGLTDTDIGDEYVRFGIQGGFNRFEYAVQAIEAKLKERNG